VYIDFSKGCRLKRAFYVAHNRSTYMKLEDDKLYCNYRFRTYLLYAKMIVKDVRQRR